MHCPLPASFSPAPVHGEAVYRSAVFARRLTTGRWQHWNGWHALSGFLLWIPGIAAALISRQAAYAYGLGAAGAVFAPAVYLLFDKTPLGLLDFPNPVSDVIFHLTFAALLVWAVAPELRGRQPATG